jgi:hypothetical protein
VRPGFEIVRSGCFISLRQFDGVLPGKIDAKRANG